MHVDRVWARNALCCQQASAFQWRRVLYPNVNRQLIKRVLEWLQNSQSASIYPFYFLIYHHQWIQLSSHYCQFFHPFFDISNKFSSLAFGDDTKTCRISYSMDNQADISHNAVMQPVNISHMCVATELASWLSSSVSAELWVRARLCSCLYASVDRVVQALQVADIRSLSSYWKILPWIILPVIWF